MIEISMNLCLLFVCLVNCISCSDFVYSSEKNIFEGTIDDYNQTLLDRRIVENITDSYFWLFKGDTIDTKLGVEDWGPISNSLLMTSYPDNYNKELAPCSISQSNVNYALIFNEFLPAYKEIYDYVIHKNEIFLLTSSTDMFFYTVVLGETGK